MVIGLLAIGMVLGAVSGIYALLSGGSLLFALAVYSGVGALSVIVMAALVGFASRLRAAAQALARDKAAHDPQSA